MRPSFCSDSELARKCGLENAGINKLVKNFQKAPLFEAEKKNYPVCRRAACLEGEIRIDSGFPLYIPALTECGYSSDSSN